MGNTDLIIKADMPLAKKTLGLLLCIAQEKTTEMTRYIAPLGISLLQVDILHTLHHTPEGRLTVNDIKAQMIDSSPNVSRSLNKLMEKGLITKERSQDDQRVVFISITDQGRAMHEQADEVLEHISLNLTDQEVEVLYDLLVKL